MKSAELLEKLKSGGHKLTPARRKVAEVLCRQGDKPFTAEAIYRRCRGACDQASVYRTLTLLEKEGVVERSDLSGEATRFVLARAGHDHRHHIECTRCHRVDVVDVCTVKLLDKELRRLGYRDVRHRLEFSGTCPDCS